MQAIKTTDTAFRGTAGYHHTTIENICTLIAKGIVDARQSQTVEVCIAFGNSYQIGQYILEAA